MPATGLTLYKLIILYMLDRVTFPLTNNQITSFILDQGYTDYFHIQQAMSELVESGLITTETIRNASYCQATQEGTHTLEYFGKDVSDSIKNDVDEYLKDNAFELRSEVSSICDYDRNVDGDYSVHCVVKEGHVNLIDLTISVPTEEAAKAVCKNWDTESQPLYMHILETLVK